MAMSARVFFLYLEGFFICHLVILMVNRHHTRNNICEVGRFGIDTAKAN